MHWILFALVAAGGPHQVAAPASDVLSGIVRLPDPASAPSTSRGAILPLRFRRVPGIGWSADLEIPVERSGPLSVALFSPDAGSWTLATGTPLAFERTLAPVGDEMPGWNVDRYDAAIVAPGRLSLRVDADDPRGARPPSEGWLLARTSTGLAAEAWLSTLEAVAGNDLRIVARETSGRGRVETARALVEDATGPVEIRMDPFGDGTFRASLPESIRGDVRARVELRGTADSGFPFLVVVPMSFPVLEREVALEGGARAEAVDDLRLAIEIGVLRLGFMDRFHTSAEVWGTDADGTLVPVCWLSHIDPSFTLTLDARWIALAGARAPFELREVRVQDPATEVVLDRVARMPLEVGALPEAASRRIRAVEPDMLTGAAPGKPRIGLLPSLMLVHGYCSGGSIWPAADFTQPKTVFLDPNANRTHDQFAQRIAQQAQAAGLTSFGVVTHSQGGCAALHLLTYYTSGLDSARHGRKIQSLAAPFQGTPLASLGFFACGVNNDMTPSGSATWLAGIPTWARAQVYYWTTSNSGSTVCNSLTEFFLGDPNDGTVEMSRGQLSGANSMGHTTGWCHTTGMSFPASYTDHTRNQLMNAAAAR